MKHFDLITLNKPAVKNLQYLRTLHTVDCQYFPGEEIPSFQIRQRLFDFDIDRSSYGQVGNCDSHKLERKHSILSRLGEVSLFNSTNRS